MSDRQSPRNVLLNVLLVASCGIGLTQSFAVSAAVQQQPPVPPALLGDKHADLLPEQNVLLDDWFRRFGEVVKKSVSLSPQILLPHKTPTATPANRCCGNA